MTDIRYALRTLMARPSFTMVAVLTLAIGIGANVAIFSLVSGVLLKPLPLKDPERLVVIWDTHPSLPMPFMVVSPPRVLAWRQATQLFEDVGAFSEVKLTIADAGAAEQITGAQVYQGMLPTLGVPPVIGRFFTDAEMAANGPRVVILGDALWRGRFSADPTLLGRTVQLSGLDYTVVGVMPPSFNFVPSVTIEGKPPLQRAQFFIPQRVANPETQAGAHFLTTIGRLRDGVTISRANTELKAIAARLAADNRGHEQWSVEVVPLLSQATGGVRSTLVTLLGAVAFVLLLACTNVANLLLARGVGRRRELAVRAALGASRLRLARQLSTESMVLSAAGGAAGLLIASWCVRFVRIYGPASITRLDEVQVDQRVVLFAVGTSLVAAIVFGLAPLAQMLRPSTIDALKQRSGAVGSTRVRSTLVIAEVAFAIVLLVGGVLLAQSVFKRLNASPGFVPSRAVSFHIATPPRYATRADLLRFNETVVRSLRLVPGIETAAATDSLPIAESRQGTTLIFDSMPPLPDDQTPRASFCFPTDGYFEALGVPLLRGRTFNEQDRSDSAPVIAINQAVATRYFGTVNPIGRTMRAGFNSRQSREIVGVVGDEAHTGLGRPPVMSVYIPYSQVNWTGAMSYVARSSIDETTTLAAVRQAVRNVDAGAAIYGVRTLDSIVAESVATERFAAGLFGAFAVAALALAFVGVYGVTDQAVSQRMQEFGVRIALGADRPHIRTLVIGGSLRLTAIGIAIGIVAAAALSRVIAGQLFDVSPFDPIAYGGVAAMLAVSGIVAAYAPARRATRVDPMIALRAE